MKESLYREYQDLLFPIALNLLKDREDAEDLVQDTLLAWLSKDTQHIENAKGYLVRTLINKCLNRIRAQKTAQDIDIAPELLVDYLPSMVENKDRLSLSLLRMMERLSPLERAVFILKELFGYSHKEVAELLGITESYSRQILVRAKRHLDSDKERFVVDPTIHNELYERFIEACKGEDLYKLIEILKEDVRLYESGISAFSRSSDVKAISRLGVAEYVYTIIKQAGESTWFEWCYWEGMPVFMWYIWGMPVAVWKLRSENEDISQIEILWLEELQTYWLGEHAIYMPYSSSAW